MGVDSHQLLPDVFGLLEFAQMSERGRQVGAREIGRRIERYSFAEVRHRLVILATQKICHAKEV